MSPIRPLSAAVRSVPARAAGVLAAALLTAAASPASAGSAREVLERAQERQEKQFAGIAAYTLTQTVMGHDVTQRFEKRVVDGHATMVPVDGPGAGQFDVTGTYRDLREAAEHARLDGTATIEGNTCDVVRIDDMSKLEFGEDLGTPDSDFRPRSGAFCFDRKTSFMRRMTMTGDATNDGRTSEVTMTIDLLDWRDVSGLSYPHRTVMSMTGMESAMSSEDLEEARRSLAEMKKQMASMPEEQRKMMESMMGGQLEQLEKMAGGDGMEMEITVRSLEVERE